MSYSIVQFPFTFEPSRWFSHLSRQALGDLNRALPVFMKRPREISFHLSPSSLHHTPSTCIQASLPDRSQQHGLLFLLPVRLLRAADHDQPMKLQKIRIFLEEHRRKSREVVFVLRGGATYFETLPVTFEVAL